MGLFSSIKSFVVDKNKQNENNNNKNQVLVNNTDNFNAEVQQNNIEKEVPNFNLSNDNNINNNNNNNNPLVHQVIPNQNNYIRPNETYKQHQLNDTEMLYQVNNTFRPARMNPANQYNYYINNDVQQSAIESELSPVRMTPPPGYVEPYYNHEAAQNYVRPVQPQILPRNRTQQYPQEMPNQQRYYHNSQYDPRWVEYGTPNYGTQNDGYFNDEHVYVNQYRRPYQRRIVNPNNQLQFDDQFNQQDMYYQNQPYPYYPPAMANPSYLNQNNIPPFNGHGMVRQYEPTAVNNTTLQIEDPALTNVLENKRYAYQPQLANKSHSNRFSKEYANKLIPLEIAREIRSEKIRTLIMIIIGFCGTVATSLFIALYFISHNQKLDVIMEIKAKYIPHPFLTITLLLISLGILFAGIFDLSRVRIETNNYLLNLNRGNHTIPHFLIDNYKKMTVRSIVLNWIAFPVYFFGAIVLGILYGFQEHAGQEFMFGFWSWGIVDDLTAAITITIIILITVLGIHIANIVLTKKRKANIIGYYGYEIVKPEELAALRKKTNRICLVIFIIFLIILTLVISIAWLIARRKKQRGVPLFSRWFGRK